MIQRGEKVGRSSRYYLGHRDQRGPERIHTFGDDIHSALCREKHILHVALLGSFCL